MSYYVLLGVGVFMLVNVAWIVCNRWRYGLKRVSPKPQAEKPSPSPPPQAYKTAGYEHMGFVYVRKHTSCMETSPMYENMLDLYVAR